MKRPVLSFVALTLCLGLALAQQPTARLNGAVVDTAGMPIPKVQITVRNSTASFNAVSDENGKFKLDVPPGMYEVHSDKLPGFATTNRNLTIAPGKVAEITIVPAISMDDAICILIVTSGPIAKRHKRKRHRRPAASNK